MARLTLQNEELKELVANCERTIAQKDSIIANLTTSLNKQKTKEGLVRSFNQWKLRYCDEKREVRLDFAFVEFDEFPIDDKTCLSNIYSIDL